MVVAGKGRSFFFFYLLHMVYAFKFPSFHDDSKMYFSSRIYLFSGSSAHEFEEKEMDCWLLLNDFVANIFI